MWELDARSLPQGPGARGYQVFNIAVIFVIVAGLVVIARITTRLRTEARVPNQGSRLWWDDYCIMFALLMSVILTITECQAVVNGYGNHFQYLGPDRATNALQWFYFAQIFYKLTITFDKIAILLFYLRIFPSKHVRILSLVGLGIVALTNVAFVIGTVFQCSPIEFFWHRMIPGGRCIPSAPWWYSYSAINIFTDLYIFVLPLPSLAALSLRMRHKIALLGVFALGGFVCITTIIRMTTLASSAGIDPTFDPIPATVWSIIEANSGMICACLPLLKVYFDRFLHIFGVRSDSVARVPADFHKCASNSITSQTYASDGGDLEGSSSSAAEGERMRMFPAGRILKIVEVSVHVEKGAKGGQTVAERTGSMTTCESQRGMEMFRPVHYGR